MVGENITPHPEVSASETMHYIVVFGEMGKGGDSAETYQGALCCAACFCCCFLFVFFPSFFTFILPWARFHIVYQEAQCQVLGAELEECSFGCSPRPSPEGSNAEARPVFEVKVIVSESDTWQALAFDSPAKDFIGESFAKNIVESYDVGGNSTAPCWYDPGDRENVVLRSSDEYPGYVITTFVWCGISGLCCLSPCIISILCVWCGLLVGSTEKLLDVLETHGNYPWLFEGRRAMLGDRREDENGQDDMTASLRRRDYGDDDDAVLRERARVDLEMEMMM